MQPNATNRPRIAPGRNQTGTHPNLTPKQSTQNIRTAILTAIFTIELNCNKIAKPQRIARGLKGLHQNPGKSTNCKKTAPIAPRIGILSQSVRDQSAIHPKPFATHARSRHNRPKNDLNQLNQTGLQLDCKIKKDCKAIGWIALKLHRFQVNCSNCTPTIHGIRCNPQTPTHIASPSCPQLHSTYQHKLTTQSQCNLVTQPHLREKK